MPHDLEATREFENIVRRVAEAVWGLPAGGCQPQHYTTDKTVRELDGLARMRDVIHLIMVTTSTRLDKVKEDVKKLNAAARIEGASGIATSKWLITSKHLEAEHLRHAREHAVTALTLQQFRSRFFDGRDYITKRRTGAFGSARNLSNGTITIPEDEYVALPMTELPYDRVSGLARVAAGRDIGISDLVGALKAGNTVVITAPFGSGKSLSAREVFLRLAKEHLRGDLERAPIALNLREHWGSLYSDEILERHARSIGFTPRENLTAAWRADMTLLIIDGFDEVASQAIARSSDRNFMREARAQALQAVRDLISKTPSGTGMLICGRDHYFDSLTELEHALGLTGRQFVIVRLDEFTEEQVSRFLVKHVSRTAIPDWLPRKPLILGYLAHQGLLRDILAIDSSQGFGFAWDSFLTLVSEREASHERAAMDAQTVRRVLERLACDVRGTSSGTGPITGVDLAEAYRLETGEVAGEGVLMQLQRLPGLTPRDQDPTARSFVDEDLLAALQGSAIARVILESATPWTSRKWLNPLPARALSVAAHLVRRVGGTADTATATALRALNSPSLTNQEKQVAADILAVALELAREDGVLDGRSLFLESAALTSIDLEEMRVDNLQLRHCLIDEVTIGARTAESTIRLTDCLIGKVVGVSSEAALPNDVFQGCTGESYDDASTNAAMMRLKAPPGVKALASVLRKLYLQSGGGRKLSALKRGITDLAVAACIDGVLRVLENEGMVTLSNGIAHPIRRQTTRAKRIIAELATSQDPVMLRSMNIQ
jgi:hypothetical protein